MFYFGLNDSVFTSQNALNSRKLVELLSLQLKSSDLWHPFFETTRMLSEKSRAKRQEGGEIGIGTVQKRPEVLIFGVSAMTSRVNLV